MTKKQYLRMEPSVHYDKVKDSYTKQDFNIVCIDSDLIQSENDLLTEFATQLKFPSYFGYNLDALFECLRDLEWLESQKTAVLIQQYQTLEGKKLSGPLLSILKDTHDYWRRQGIKFDVVIFNNSI